jgi:hypothetical protein
MRHAVLHASVSAALLGVAALGAWVVLGHRGAPPAGTVALWLAVAVTAGLGALWAWAARDVVASWQSCPVCFALRPSVRALDAHTRRRHRQPLRSLLEPGLACDRCPRTFRSHEALRQHRCDRHGGTAGADEISV